MIEIQQFGWNLVTFGFLGAITMSFLGFWGVFEQGRTIWRTKSGKSVSVTLFAFDSLRFSAGCIYGLTIGSLALTIVGFRVLLQLFVLIGLWRYKGYRSWETLLCLAFAGALIADIVLPHKGVMYFAIAMLAIGAMIPQIIEMLMNRSRGAVDKRFLWSTLIGVTFWTAYSFAIADWALMIIYPTFLTLIVIMTVVWYIMPAEKVEVTTEE